MAMTKSSGANGSGEPSSKRPTLFARCLLAVAAPVVFALALEGCLRLSGFGISTHLFIPDKTPGFLRTNPDFTAAYFPEQFDIYPLNFRIARHKAPGHTRIFVLGESAVKGTPEPAFGFTSLLEAQLRASYPDKHFEVYNLGIVAINSHVVYQAALEAAALEPDLFVVYMGNNEVVGPFGPGSTHLSDVPPLWIIRTSIWAGGTRTGQLMKRLVSAFSKPASSRPIEWHGMSSFIDKTVRGDDPRLERVYRYYEANLRAIVDVAAHAGIKTVLATVVANLKDCPPFASLHRPTLNEAELGQWTTLYEEGKRSWELDQDEDAILKLSNSLKLDPEFAEAHYILGTLLERKGDEPAARAQFLEALHWDALRFRPDSEINTITRRVASENPGNVALADTALALGSDAASTTPPTGRDVLLEHVHFTWEGNVRMVRILAEKCARALFGASAQQPTWLDDAGCARAAGYTELGHLRMLKQMDSIRGKPPFTRQLTFGEDQARYQHEIAVIEKAATSSGGLSAARAQLEAALARDPKNPNLLLRLSEVESQSGHPDRVLILIERAMEQMPLSAELMVQRARALASLQRGNEAQADIVAALQIDPRNLPTYTALVDILRKSGDFEMGRKLFSEALSRNPDSGFIRLSYADLLFFHGDRDKAVHECQSVLARDPGDSDALRRLVSLYSAEKRTGEAFDLMSEARKTQPMNFENDLALARIYEERGDNDQVADCLEAAALSGPATAQVHLYLARRLSKLNRPVDALVELSRGRRVAVLTGNQQLAEEISTAMLPSGGN
jgi:tetratricopeptide (TPR) repeat protein